MFLQKKSLFICVIQKNILTLHPNLRWREVSLIKWGGFRHIRTHSWVQ